MKNVIALLIIGLSFHLLTAQNRVDISMIKIKKKKVIDYKTDYATHFKNTYFYFLDGKKYTGIIFENWENGNLKTEFEVINGEKDDYYRSNVYPFEIRGEYHRSFHTNGNVKMISIERKKAFGDYVTGYDQNGKIRSFISILPIEKQRDTLTISTYYNNDGKIMNHLKKLSTEEEGNRITTFTFYHHGRITRIESYKNGMPHGLHLNYDAKTGQLRHQTNYENGERHGLEISHPLWGETTRVKWVNGKRIIRNL